MKPLTFLAVGVAALLALIMAVTVSAPARGAVYQAANSAPTNASGGAAAGARAGGESAAWDPGNIISDQVFYNASAMTVDQIRDFIAQRGADCNGTWCLRTLRVSFPAQPADQYCQAIQAGADVDAAEAVSRFSTACGINPQVMLVTLQKESQLLNRTDASEASYDAAWGWHCPDTGPGGSANCDPQYAGFFNQGYGMAKQWSRYRQGIPTGEYPRYQPGKSVEILWNVEESGCGGAPVTIANIATASLYTYTPYQPNEASLSTYPGTGDRCSSYGNRNFFRMFQSYFGDTGGGIAQTAVAANGAGTVAANGVTVTIPADKPANLVVPAMAGKTITAPNEGVARGLAAGFGALGLPYVWGGGGSGAPANNGCERGGGDYNSCGSEIGFDCSGLTAWVLGNAGFSGIPGDSGSQRSGGTSIPWDQAQPGDIVGFPAHVAIYLGTYDGQRYILEASWVGTPIHIVPLTRSDYDAQVHRYWS